MSREQDLSCNSSAVTISLEESDIEGATLEEPLETKTIPQLRWWLTCHGVEPPSSEKKTALIARVRQVKLEGTKVIDVDGTYLERKRQKLLSQNSSVAPLPCPGFPMIGWKVITLSDHPQEMPAEIPSISQSTLYTYLAEGVGNAKGSMAFRALKQGFKHYASGRLSKLEIQALHPGYAFVRSSMIPSMRSGTYRVKLILKKRLVHEKLVGSIHAATCECAAGLSASCIHVSALLHALVALTPSVHTRGEEDSDDENLPITSLPCQWKPPRKRKAAAMQVSEAHFDKLDYGKAKKYTMEVLENYDPRPEELKNTSAQRLPQLLNDIRGEDLCVSLLLDSSTRVDSGEQSQLTKSELLQKVETFKKTLEVSEEDVRKIELSTRAQSQSPKWFEVRRHRLTASKFGHVKRLKPSTPPDNLVLSILGVKQAFGAPIEYGKAMEKTALDEYVLYQQSHGHPDLYATSSGVLVSLTHSFLAASPDANIYDPTSCDPFGFAEIKCAYKYRDLTPEQAAENSDFMLCRELNGDLSLKPNHVYRSQIQGQMGIGGRKWCDFIVYTSKGIHIQRINFDRQFWENELLPKLHSFYNLCLAPEIVYPQHPLDLPLRDLRTE